MLTKFCFVRLLNKTDYFPVWLQMHFIPLFSFMYWSYSCIETIGWYLFTRTFGGNNFKNVTMTHLHAPGSLRSCREVHFTVLQPKKACANIIFRLGFVNNILFTILPLNWTQSVISHSCSWENKTTKLTELHSLFPSSEPTKLYEGHVETFCVLRASVM